MTHNWHNMQYNKSSCYRSTVHKCAKATLPNDSCDHWPYLCNWFIYISALFFFIHFVMIRNAALALLLPSFVHKNSSCCLYCLCDCKTQVDNLLYVACIVVMYCARVRTDHNMLWLMKMSLISMWMCKCSPPTVLFNQPLCKIIFILFYFVFGTVCFLKRDLKSMIFLRNDSKMSSVL